jgi:hypothetical protein
MVLNVPECPMCDEPLNGGSCRHCEYSKDMDVTECDSCGEVVPEREVESETVAVDSVQHGLRRVTNDYCEVCQ